MGVKPPQGNSDKPTTETSEEGKDDNNAPGRRYEDGHKYGESARKMNLDRRVKSRDRRLRDDPNYKGPARRMNIDRRQRNSDRRTKD